MLQLLFMVADEKTADELSIIDSNPRFPLGTQQAWKHVL